MLRHKRFLIAALITVGAGLGLMMGLAIDRTTEYGYTPFTCIDTAIGASLADTDAHTCSVPVAGPCYIGIAVENTDVAVAWTDFALQTREHTSADWNTKLSGTDFSETSLAILSHASSGITTLAAAAKGYAWFVVDGPCEVRFAAATASAGKMTVRGNVCRK